MLLLFCLMKTFFLIRMSWNKKESLVASHIGYFLKCLLYIPIPPFENFLFISINKFLIKTKQFNSYRLDNRPTTTHRSSSHLGNKTNNWKTDFMKWKGFSTAKEKKSIGHVGSLLNARKSLQSIYWKKSKFEIQKEFKKTKYEENNITLRKVALHIEIFQLNWLLFSAVLWR